MTESKAVSISSAVSGLDSTSAVEYIAVVTIVAASMFRSHVPVK